MIVPVVSLFILMSFFFLIKGKGLPYYTIGGIVVLWTILVLIAAFRPSEMPDYENYYNAFRYVTAERFEPAVSWIISFVHLFSRNPLVLFGLFAMISITLKFGAIVRLSPCFWGSMLIYIANIFILHDMIQIRCAVASGLLLWALMYVYERNLYKFLVISRIAVLFHYSAILIFPLYFLDTKRCHQVWRLIIPAAYVLWLLNFKLGYLAEFIPGDSFQTLWAMYEATVGNEDGVNVFNMLQLLRCVVCLFIVWNIDRISQHNQFAILLTKVYCLSLVSLVLFSDVAVIAFRVSELYQVVEVLLLPMIVFCFSRTVSIGKLCVIMIGVVLLYINVSYTEILN